MEIARIFNNNVVLAVDDAGREVILTGRGLGFQTRPGQSVNDSLVVRTFVPTDGRDPDHLAELVAGIAPEYISMVGEALAEIGASQLADNPALVVALSDHVSYALRRAAIGLHLEYPLLAEVQHLYAEEYQQAQQLLAAINARSTTQLPDEEAVGLALHLVNASFTTGDLSYTYKMTGVIQQLVTVIEQAFGVTLPSGSVSVGRFITHLRYLFVRIRQHTQLREGHSAIGAAIRESYPQAAECAQRLASILELRLGETLTEDEVSYLALHVARVTTDA